MDGVPAERPAPVRGERVELEITDVSSRGFGVGRTAHGLVVMLRGAVPGDRVQATVTRMRGAHAEAALDRLLRASPHRVEPRCRHFGRCGGCALQNLAPAAQRCLKGRRVAELMRRSAGLAEVPVDDTVAVGPDYGARGRMEFSFGGDPDRVVVGLHDLGGEVFDLQECHLPHPLLVSLVGRIRDLVRRHRLAAAGSGLGARGLRRLELRRSGLTGEILVCLSVSGRLPGAAELELAALPSAVPEVTSVVVRQEDGRQRVVAGSGVLRERLGGVEVPVVAGAFVQAHAAGAGAIYEAALEWLLTPACGATGFLDLYAGVGPLALAAAAAGRRPVWAVEAAWAAVLAGRRAAAAQGREVSFLCLPAEVGVARVQAAGAAVGAVAANPPRTGLHRKLPGLLGRLRPRRLAYISCDPATLARDLRRLLAAGLRPVRLTPYDLFPQTAEIEVLARLQPLDAAG